MNGVPIIERAYQLARSRRFTSVVEIDQALRREGYRTFDELSGRDIRRRLADVCNGRTSAPAKPVERKPRKPGRPRILEA